MKNYYEILELDYNASFKEIRSSYRRLSKKFHPDLNPDNKESEEYYKDIQEAYHHLKDGIKREEFDAQLRALGIGRSKFGAFTKNIRDKFSPNRNTGYELDDEEDDDIHAFRPIFAPPRKKRHRGVILILFSIVVIGGIFFIESRIDNLSYNSEISSYAVDAPVAEEQSVEELKDIPSPKKEKKELATVATDPQLSLVADDKEVRSSEKRYNYAVVENSKREGVSVPVTIFSVNNIGESKAEEPLKKEASLPPVTETRTATSIPAVAASSPAGESKEVIVESKNSAASAPVEANRVYTRVDKKPTFSGGASAFVQYLNSNIQYPPSARASGINGRVLVTFVVEKTGKISNISVIQGIGGGCDEEAIRVMANAPSWVPGELNGERVRVQCTIPITFKLQ